MSLPRHPVAVGLCRGTPKRADIITSHAHCLGHISSEAHTVKELPQGVKVPLKACHLSRHKEPIASIEVFCHTMYVLPETLRVSCVRVQCLL